MVRHFIIMSSSYTDGTRIALDIAYESLLNSASLGKILRAIKERCEDEEIPLSTHFIETESKAWESVPKYDPFFEGVVCCKSVEEFADEIKASRVLNGLDVAIYILSKIKCTHLSLEKLVYFAYADYLCQYSKRLFEDKIFAFEYSPVVESVYETYKGNGVEPLGFDTDRAAKTDVKEMPARSRILFAKDGAKKLVSIDKTIQRYGKCSARELVGLTQRPESPWSYVDNSKRYPVISDERILEHHRSECPE